MPALASSDVINLALLFVSWFTPTSADGIKWLFGKCISIPNPVE